VEILAVELLDEIELLALQIERHFAVADVPDLGLRERRVRLTERGALVNSGKKSGAVVVAAAVIWLGLIVMKPGRFWFSVPRP
jgi:hypothetical protein